MSNSDEIFPNPAFDRTSIEEAINLALTKDIDNDPDYWALVRSIQKRLPQCLDAVATLCFLNEPRKRILATNILGQNSMQNKVVSEKCLELLFKMIQTGPDIPVLESILHALGHYETPEVITLLMKYAHHESGVIRLAVVHCLLSNNNDEVIETMIQLSQDSDPNVRNWATFGLGSSIDKDSEEIRNALAARLHEVDNEIRWEAILGLVVRADDRMIPVFLNDLETIPPNILLEEYQVTDIAYAIYREASKTGDKKWIPVLEKLDALSIEGKIERKTALTHCQNFE